MTLRARLFRVAKWIDRTVGRMTGPRRVLIEVRSPMNVEVLRPIWAALAADARVELTFTAIEETWVRPTLDAAGLGDRLISGTAAAWTRFDLAFNADPWDALDLRRCWRRVNFFHGVAGKYDLDDPAAIARHVDFGIYDRLMFANEDRLQRYVSAGVVTRDRAALVGFPKIDDLVNGRWSAAAVRRELGLDPALETVLYAPTFAPASSLHLAGEEIIETLLATGRNVIVKLHDRSMVPHPKYTANVDWPARLARFARRRNYAFASAAHAGPYLVAADLMITDHSTIGFEFALLDRPLVVFDAPDLLAQARINPDKWHQLRGMADIVRTAGELPAVVARALANPQRHAGSRRATSQALFAHAGHSTERALDVVYELLGLPAREQAHGVHQVHEVRP